MLQLNGNEGMQEERAESAPLLTFSQMNAALTGAYEKKDKLGVMQKLPSPAGWGSTNPGNC